MSESEAGDKWFAGKAGPASESRDSALQYVATDLADTDFSEDEQRELLAPVEEEIRTHWDDVMWRGFTKAVEHGPRYAAGWVPDELADQLSFGDVPEEHRDEIQDAVEERLAEKEDQLFGLYDNLMTEMKRRAAKVPEETLVSWEPIA